MYFTIWTSKKKTQTQTFGGGCFSKQSCHARLSSHLQLELVLGAGVQLRSPNNWMIWYTETTTGWWYPYPSEKYEFVNWDDDIPNIWKNIKCSKPPTRTRICVKNVSRELPWPKCMEWQLWRSSWISENYTPWPLGKAKQMPPWSRCCPCEPGSRANPIIKPTIWVWLLQLDYTNVRDDSLLDVLQFNASIFLKQSACSG